MNPKRLFCDSSIAFYAAGCIGYRWAVKVMNEVAIRRSRTDADSFLFMEVVNEHAWRGDFEGVRLHWRMLRRMFPAPVEVTVGDFDQAMAMRKLYKEASARVLMRAAIMRRMGVQDIAATFSSGMEKVGELRRVNLMSELNT